MIVSYTILCLVKCGGLSFSLLQWLCCSTQYYHSLNLPCFSEYTTFLLKTLQRVLMTHIPCSNECILHEICPIAWGTDIIEAVSSLQCLVHRMVHHSWWQGVKAHKVCYLSSRTLKQAIASSFSSGLQIVWNLESFFYSAAFCVI